MDSFILQRSSPVVSGSFRLSFGGWWTEEHRGYHGYTVSNMLSLLKWSLWSLPEDLKRREALSKITSIHRVCFQEIPYFGWDLIQEELMKLPPLRRKDSVSLWPFEQVSRPEFCSIRQYQPEAVQCTIQTMTATQSLVACCW